MFVLPSSISHASIISSTDFVIQLNELGYGEIATLQQDGSIFVNSGAVFDAFPPGSFPDEYGNFYPLIYFATNNISVSGNAIIKDSSNGVNLGQTYTGPPIGVYLEISGDFTINSGSVFAEYISDLQDKNITNSDILLEAILYLLSYIIGVVVIL